MINMCLALDKSPKSGKNTSCCAMCKSIKPKKARDNKSQEWSIFHTSVVSLHLNWTQDDPPKDRGCLQ